MPEPQPVTVSVPGQEPMHLVRVEDYERVRDERDALRRTLAFVGLSYWLPNRSPQTTGALLRDAGHGLPEAQAMAGIIASLRESRAATPEEPTDA